MQMYLWTCILTEECNKMVLCMISPQLGSSIKWVSPSGIRRTLWMSPFWFNIPIRHQISHLPGDRAASGLDFNLVWKADMVCIETLWFYVSKIKNTSITMPLKTIWLDPISIWNIRILRDTAQPFLIIWFASRSQFQINSDMAEYQLIL